MRSFLRSRDGATAIEYVLLVALLGFALIGILTGFSGALDTNIQGVGAKVSDVLAPAPARKE